MSKKAKAPKKAGKRAEAAARYANLKAAWERRRRDPAHAGGGNWLVDAVDLPLAAVPFLQTLRVLGDVTQDPRFADLHHWIMRSNLIDRRTGHWSRPGTTLARPDMRTAFEMIEDMIKDRISERLAIAEVVTELALCAQSFDAAQKSVKRLLDQYRKLS